MTRLLVEKVKLDLDWKTVEIKIKYLTNSSRKNKEPRTDLNFDSNTFMEVSSIKIGVTLLFKPLQINL